MMTTTRTIYVEFEQALFEAKKQLWSRSPLIKSGKYVYLQLSAICYLNSDVEEGEQMSPSVTSVIRLGLRE